MLIATAAVAVTLCLGSAVLPRVALPIHDEAFYIGPAVRLAETGQLRLGGGIYPSSVSLIAWGAAFVKLLGGDFVTLRLSMLVAGALGAVTFYALLRQLGVDRTRSALGLSAFVLNPFFVYHSVLFRTDLLFVVLLLGSLYAGVIGLRTGRGWLMLVAGSLTAAAFLTRQLGVVAAPALAAALLASPGLRRSPRLWLGLLTPPIVAVAVFAAWRYGPNMPAGADDVFRTSAQRWGSGVGFAVEMARRLGQTLPYLGLFGLPLVVAYAPGLPTHLACLGRRRKLALAGGMILAATGYVIGWLRGNPHFPYLIDALDPRGLHIMYFLGPAAVPFELDGPLMLAVTLAMWLSAGVITGLALGALPPSPGRWWLHPHFPIYLTGALLALATLSAHLLMDRYLFPLLPFVLLLALQVTRPLRASLPLLAAVLAVSGAVTILLMVDYQTRVALRWEIAMDLVRRGTPATAINAGYEWIAWWTERDYYGIGEELSEEPGPSPMPEPPRYRILSSPIPGYQVERTYPYWTPLGWRTRHLHLLRPKATGRVRRASAPRRWARPTGTGRA